ncbi:metallophosphoesterase [Corynebacterium sp.]|uniref:metallophosphoesterase n=1 Tax=Corynebacterium sp. TaxID=1720 RepID=UPI003735BA60
MSDQPSGINRRTFLTGTSVIGAAVALGSLTPAARAQSASTTAGKPALKFNSDGKFKIIQFNDTQDDHLTDRRTIEFMEKALDQEKPDFALINGDVITSGPRNNQQVFQALNNVVLPMENRSIPWAVTFGNHDEDSTDDGTTTAYEPVMLDFLRQYKFNMNAPATDVYGESNTNLVVAGSTTSDAAFAIWMLDSGRYVEDTINGQNREEIPGYDYLRPDQIRWYEEQSQALEARYGRKIPGLMYFHIPLYEHRDMWFGGPYNNSEADHAKAVETHGIVGVKHEGVYVGAFNSGMYAAVLQRGDVKGIFCGHDHINTYVGNYFGVELGYGPGTGFGPYGLNDGTWDQHTLRGARVFELNENTERVYESTRIVWARELGIDMNPAAQKISEPLPLPDYVNGVEPAPAPDDTAGSAQLSSGLSSNFSSSF